MKKTGVGVSLRGLAGKLLLGCVSVLIALLALESGLRLLRITYPRVAQRDEFRGNAGIPHRQYWHTSEGRAFIELNNAGFRDRDWTTEKPPGTLRIAVLGDSYAEALGVDAESRFTEILERQLNRDRTFGDKSVEVLNFGVSGYGTAQELLTLRHVAWGYDPDIVVVAFLTGNDLTNNVESLDLSPGRPYFTLESGRLTLDTSFRDSAGPVESRARRFVHAAADYSYLVQVALRARLLRQARSLSAMQFEATGGGGEVGLSQSIYGPPESPEWIDAWQVTEAILAAMNDEVEARGKKFLVVTLSNARQVDPDIELREESARRLGVEDLFYPDRRLLALGQERGFAVVALAPALAEFAASQGTYLHGFENTQMGTGHWNRDGHLQAARLIGEELDRLARTSWKGAF